MPKPWANSTSDTVVGLPVPRATQPLDELATGETRWLSDWTGLPWFAEHVETHQWKAASAGDLPPIRVRSLPLSRSGIIIQPLHSSLCWYALDADVMSCDQLRYCGYVFLDQKPELQEWLQLLKASSWSLDRLERAWANVPVCSPILLERLLRTVVHERERLVGTRQHQKQTQKLTTFVTLLNTEIALFLDLIEHLNTQTSVSDMAAVAFEKLPLLVPADAYVLWLFQSPEGAGIHASGDPQLSDPRVLTELVSYLNQVSPNQPIVTALPAWNHLSGGERLKHCIAVPLHRHKGWLLVCNQHAPVILPSHAEAMHGLAHLLTIPLHQAELRHENEELAVGVIRSLVTTLDAKDRYTRGHSERVARIARRLGAQLNLPPPALDDLFLAGLLHDIGKIGVNDQILQKVEPLTPEEFREIQRHPVIGYELLAPIKRLEGILPAVRHHHEAYNGSGYPDGLAGENIPQMARIIAVADAFDAMISDRPYRAGLPRERVEGIFHRGFDEQWDGRVLQAYFQARSDIFELLNSYETACQIPLPARRDKNSPQRQKYCQAIS